MKHSILTAAAIALAMGAAPPHASAAPDELVVVDVAPVAAKLAAHLRVGLDEVPGAIDLPNKLAAVVCEVSLKTLRDSDAGSGARCVAIGMSQGLIEAVRQAMRGR